MGVREGRALRQRMDALQKLPPGLAGETVLAMTDTDLDLLAAAAAGPEAHYEWVLGNIARRHNERARTSKAAPEEALWREAKRREEDTRARRVAFYEHLEAARRNRRAWEATG